MKTKIFRLSQLIIFTLIILLTQTCKKEEEIKIDETNPTVSILYPANNSEFEEDAVITIKTDATDNEKVKEVSFLIDGDVVGTDTSEPYEYEWNTTGEPGSHTIKVKALDAAKNIGESDVISVEITKKEVIPAVTTSTISAITSNSAESGGNVTDDGGASITARGVCWGTNNDPTIAGSHTSDGTGTGTFTSSLSVLEAVTTYYVRAYATNSSGTAYGNEESFTTTGGNQTGTVTDYDGNTYQTITIGSQEWMAENLKVTHYANGTAIPLVTDNTAWANLGDNNTDKAYCYYDNSDANRDTYGALYTYAAAMNSASSSSANPIGVQGVCPTGWHLPSDAEWKELEMYLGISQSEADGTGYRGTNEGSKLAGNASLWSNGSLETNAGFGTSGFSALPGGWRYYNSGVFHYLGLYGVWWSDTEYDATNAWEQFLYYSNSNVGRYSSSKGYGFSVRCLRD